MTPEDREKIKVYLKCRLNSTRPTTIYVCVLYLDFVLKVIDIVKSRVVIVRERKANNSRRESCLSNEGSKSSSIYTSKKLDLSDVYVSGILCYRSCDCAVVITSFSASVAFVGTISRRRYSRSRKASAYRCLLYTSDAADE